MHILIRYARKVNLTFWVRISTRDSASLVPGRNSDSSGEISRTYMVTHDGLLYSVREANPFVLKVDPFEKGSKMKF